MIKFVKLGLLLLIIGIVISVGTSKADGSVHWGPVVLPASSGPYTSKNYYKNEVSNQAMHVTESLDTISGDYRIVLARTYKLDVTSYSPWIVTEKGKYVKWDYDAHRYVANYNVRLKAQRSTLTKVNYWAAWIYNYWA